MIITLKEYIGTLVVACVIWGLFPWDPSMTMTRTQLVVAFIGVAAMAIGVVILTEMVIDQIDRWIEGI